MVCVSFWVIGVHSQKLIGLYGAGLRLCKWAGRNQVVQQGNVTYYLDGAHTPQSMEASAQWFLSEIKIETRSVSLVIYQARSVWKKPAYRGGGLGSKINTDRGVSVCMIGVLQ